MSETNQLYNSVAPLRNVTALVTLIHRVKERALGLPGMATFYGYSGYGKTTAAVYAANKFNALQVQVKESWTGKKLCQAILGEMSLHQSLIAPWIIKGAMNGEAFAACIREVLTPELEPGTVVICDNLATHKNVEAAAALREHGCWFLYLPPYSPDLNPIEMAFAKLKAHLRRLGARTFDQLFEALAEVCDLFTPDECWNYFREAGYASK